MSTDAGNAAAPEDIATRDVASARPGLESADPASADSATSTPETADRGIAGSAASDAGSGSGPSDSDAGADAGAAGGRTTGAADAGRSTGAGPDGSGPGDGFVAEMLRDATITGRPGETGAPPAEPHAPQAQQQGDEPVGSEPSVGDNPRGVD